MSHHDMRPILIGIVVILYNISSENISSYGSQHKPWRMNHVSLQTKPFSYKFFSPWYWNIPAKTKVSNAVVF